MVPATPMGYVEWTLSHHSQLRRDLIHLQLHLPHPPQWNLQQYVTILLHVHFPALAVVHFSLGRAAWHGVVALWSQLHVVRIITIVVLRITLFATCVLECVSRAKMTFLELPCWTALLLTYTGHIQVPIRNQGLPLKMTILEGDHLLHDCQIWNVGFVKVCQVFKGAITICCGCTTSVFQKSWFWKS